jgi:hypothetical protein
MRSPGQAFMRWDRDAWQATGGWGTVFAAHYECLGMEVLC